jgi:hypothetical protein
MIGGVFGAAGSHNDVGVLNLSRLIQYLEQLLFPDFALAGGILPALFGDSIFQNVNHSTIIAHYNLNLFAQQEQDFIRRLNFRLSGVRPSIEHMYGQLFNLFRLLKQPRQFVLLHDAELAYRTAVSCFFILNCYTSRPPNPNPNPLHSAPSGWCCVSSLLPSPLLLLHITCVGVISVTNVV